MSNKTPLQTSSFAIRFKPASLNDYDEDAVDDDADDVVLTSDTLGGRMKKESVLFERQSVTPPPPLTTDSDNVPIGSSGNVTPFQPVAPPGSLSLLHSAPASELTSPVTNMSSPTAASKETTSQHTPVEKVSIFSGLREKLDRLSAESKEIFDRKMRRSGSADAAKITALLNGTDVTTDVKTVEMSEFSAKSNELEKDVATESVSCVHKSASAAQMSRKSKLSLTDSPDMPKRASVSPEYTLSESVAMSELLSDNCDISWKMSSVESLSTAVGTTDSHLLTVGESVLTQQSRRTQYFRKFLSVVQRRQLMSLLIAIVAYVVVPLPTYLSGFVTGVLLSSASILLYQHLTSVKPKDKLNDGVQSLPLILPGPKELKNNDGMFKGWMNELSRYDVMDFHINQTYSVFVTLEGTTMRLQTPKHGVPKRAICDEILPSVTFVRQRHYDLQGARVVLLPRDLVSKRLWSKKYPIFIEVDVKGRGLECAIRHRQQSADRITAVEGRKPMDVADSETAMLYLFARTSRQKEEWYRRFISAARGTPWPTHLSEIFDDSQSSTWQKRHRRAPSTDSTSSNISTDSNTSAVTPIDYSCLSPHYNLKEYLKYMATIMPGEVELNSMTEDDNQQSMLWLNALVGRCFLDFLREKYWAEKMRDKIQKKLCKMHVPHFIDKLTITGIELGSSVPSICRASLPYLDDRGLWVDLDITYTGGFCISMETKCNLMKLKQSSSTSPVTSELATKDKRSAVTYSDEEDSAESTTDEEKVEDNTNLDSSDDRSRPQPMGKKLLRFVDKISQSRYFQQATEYKYIKKAMEEVSNTRLVLNVEMCSVTGTLAVNIPPPPTDRIWYGFRTNPELVLSAKPRVGDREVSISPVTDWIEKKLAVEFQRVFVMPNMDDIPISLMCAHVQQPEDNCAN